jgi:16S rRNA (uracil1498-N3)-methyltransferase
MNVFYLDTTPDSDISELSEEESKHAVRVLRMQTGDDFLLADGKGNCYSARLVNAHPKRSSFTITGVTTHLRQSELHIAICPTKNSDRLEWFIEKATELGVARISFIHCSRSERTKINMERCIKTAVSAMKQSKQWWLPEIHDVSSFITFCTAQGALYQSKYIAWCETPQTKHITHELPHTSTPVLVLIGPEGDFTQQETIFATEAGFIPVSLGGSILRTETAGVYICALLREK